MSDEDNWEDDRDKELHQEENITVHSIWVNPSFLEFFQDPHAVPQDGPCWLSSAQNMNVLMVATKPAAPQDSEFSLSGEHQGEPNSASLVQEECEDGDYMASAVSGDHQGEASTGIFSPAAQEEDLASLLFQISLDDAAIPHLDPSGEDKRDYVDSTLSAEPWRQVSLEFVSGTDHHKLLWTRIVPRVRAAGRWLVLSVSAR